MNQSPNTKRLHFVLCCFAIGGLAVWVITLAAAWYWAIDKNSAVNGLVLNIGSAALTIAVGGVVGGYVKSVFDSVAEEKERVQRAAEQERAQRAAVVAFCQNILADFKEVNHIVENARLLIDAHKSAKTYGEQVRRLPDAIVILHNIKRALDPPEYSPLPELIKPTKKLSTFLKSITEEFQTHYIEVSRLQSQDEANNRHLRQEAAKTSREAPKDVTQMAWDKIKTFRALKVLRHDCPYIEEDVEKDELDALKEDLKRLQAEQAILRKEAAEYWPEPDAQDDCDEDPAQCSEAHRVLRTTYEIRFTDYMDFASNLIRARIKERLGLLPENKC